MCTREEQEVLDRKSKKSEILLKKLLDVENVETVTEMLKMQSFGLDSKAKEAQARKDTLLEYDKTAEKRTQVRVLVLKLVIHPPFLVASFQQLNYR